MKIYTSIHYLSYFRGFNLYTMFMFLFTFNLMLVICKQTVATDCDVTLCRILTSKMKTAGLGELQTRGLCTLASPERCGAARCRQLRALIGCRVYPSMATGLADCFGDAQLPKILAATEPSNMLEPNKTPQGTFLISCGLDGLRSHQNCTNLSCRRPNL